MNVWPSALSGVTCIMAAAAGLIRVTKPSVLVIKTPSAMLERIAAIRLPSAVTAATVSRILAAIWLKALANCSTSSRVVTLIC